MNISRLLPMDDHHADAEYNMAWANGVRSGCKNGDYDVYAKQEKKNSRRQTFSALMGRLGKFTNGAKTLERFHQINSLRYVSLPNEDTQRAMKAWDGRNERMAAHIAHWVHNTDYKRYVIIVGAGHVISLKKAINAAYPDIKVILMDE